tara:strand:+ start:1004 stop:1108 length:105 start_codon:yes stop_codon:yes gene_type:complete
MVDKEGVIYRDPNTGLIFKDHGDVFHYYEKSFSA